MIRVHKSIMVCLIIILNLFGSIAFANEIWSFQGSESFVRLTVFEKDELHMKLGFEAKAPVYPNIKYSDYANGNLSDRCSFGGTTEDKTIFSKYMAPTDYQVILQYSNNAQNILCQIYYNGEDGRQQKWEVPLQKQMSDVRQTTPSQASTKDAKYVYVGRDDSAKSYVDTNSIMVADNNRNNIVFIHSLILDNPTPNGIKAMLFSSVANVASSNWKVYHVMITAYDVNGKILINKQMSNWEPVNNGDLLWETINFCKGRAYR